MDKFESIIPESQALEILGPYFKTFAEIHEHAMQAFVNDGKYLTYKLTNGCKSTIIHDLIVDEAKNRLPFGKRCEQDTVDGLYIVIVEEVIILRFKKLGNDLTTSNQPSEQAKRFNTQKSILNGQQLRFSFIKEEPIIKPNAVNINVGYIPNRTLTGIHALYMTAPRNDKKNLWQYLFYVDGNLLSHDKPGIQEVASTKEQKRYIVDVQNHLKKDSAGEKTD
ncbi:MAG: hypothetical protein O6940_02490 [Ignavibacteria bacterium]|nr:hypothetical protein [Ignavibacteria bacterium]